MNDIHEASTNFKATLYVNDINLISPLCSFSNSASIKGMKMEELSVNISNELDSISERLSINKLSLNVKKTKFMLFHIYQRNVKYFTLKLAINSEPIERVREFNLLGLTIDQLLRSNLWSSQFVTVSQFVTESVAICDGCRNLWRKVSQFVTTSKYAIQWHIFTQFR